MVIPEPDDVDADCWPVFEQPALDWLRAGTTSEHRPMAQRAVHMTPKPMIAD